MDTAPQREGPSAVRLKARRSEMKRISPWLCAMGAFVVLAGPAMAADAIAAGKIKAVNAEKKDIVLTDSDGKDWTIKLGDNVVINRGGKESQSDLNAGDPVNVCYDKGLLTWTAHYILVQEGNTKDCELVHGTVKNYDVDKKQVTFTDHRDKNWTFPMGDAKVRLNREDSKIQDLKIGDSALAIVEKTGDSTTLKCLMVERK
jgi:Cu/Ag efflux protein CusF